MLLQQPGTTFRAQWPQWLDAHRVDDAALAAAYDSSDPEERACLKNGIAFQAMAGEGLDEEERRITDRAKGYCLHRTSSPAPWTVLFCTPDYAAAPRFAAALMPALLARVPLVGVVCLGGMFSPSLLLALELLGVEDSFCLMGAPPQEDALRLLKDMAQQDGLRTGGQGRALLLHNGELTPLRDTARQLRLPWWEEDNPPRLHTEQAAAEQRKLLAWGHPDALSPASETARDPQASWKTKAWDAAYVTAMPATPPAPLTFLPGMEGCWQHQGLTATFFDNIRLTAAPLAAWQGDDA